MTLIQMRNCRNLAPLWIACQRSRNLLQNLYLHQLLFLLRINKINPIERTENRPHVRTPVRRQLTRYAFEFYQDQVEELRNLSLEEKMQGGKGSMSEMVREAIDAYLTLKKRTGE